MAKGKQIYLTEKENEIILEAITMLEDDYDLVEGHPCHEDLEKIRDKLFK